MFIYFCQVQIMNSFKRPFLPPSQRLVPNLSSPGDNTGLADISASCDRKPMAFWSRLIAGGNLEYKLRTFVS